MTSDIDARISLQLKRLEDPNLTREEIRTIEYKLELLRQEKLEPRLE